ncbi:hypothetical protein AB0C33_37540 [Nonomuraea sp. NPDC048881]|uniref:hypothetical protein n=1 Tax=Nonomuraea sp. NPDC048881 TaxID=3155030 RepID=UPI0033C96173
MPEAVISYVGAMPYQPGGVVDLHPFVPCLTVHVGGSLLFRVHVQLSWEGSLNGTRQLEALGFSTAEAEDQVSQALLLYGVRRLELLTKDWLSNDTKPHNVGDVWGLTTENVPELLALVHEKTCDYQVRLQRDLFCTAASEADATLTNITIKSRLTAPTSKPLCRDCGLPDTDFICSHLMHSKVAATSTLGGIVERSVRSALCDKGHHEKVYKIGQCRAGGHDCWQRLVEVQEPTITPASPLELAEAFDVLDAVWRLAFDKKTPLLSLSTVATPAALSLECATRAEFETRMSDLADLIDRIKVDEKLLRPRSEEEQKRDEGQLRGSLNRLEDCLHHKLPAEQHPAVDKAIRTLRTIRQARNAEQHGITEGGGLTAKLRDLGIHDAPPNWSGAWAAVRSRAVGALTGLRHELMTWVNRP